jgi:hypothetical protein
MFAAAEAGPFLRSETTAAEFTARYTRAWKRAFSGRMMLGRISHAALSNPRRARLVVALGRRAPAVIRAVVGLTRSSK